MAEIDLYGMAGYLTVKRSEMMLAFTGPNGTTTYSYPSEESSNLATTFGGRLSLKVSGRVRVLSNVQVSTSKLTGYSMFVGQKIYVGYSSIGLLIGMQLAL